MIELVQLGRRHGYDQLRDTLRVALEIGCIDADAIRHLVESPSLSRAASSELVQSQLGELGRYERPLPHVGHYDRLVDEQAHEVSR